MIYVIFALIILAFIGLAIYLNYLARKRREELAAWAKSYGFRFLPDEDHSFDQRFSRFSCLQQGSRRYAYNVTLGMHFERTFSAFDYHYETYSTDSKGRRSTHHHYFSAVVVDSGLPLRPLYIRAEGWFDKIAEFVGVDDIDFESHEFSRKFHVKAPNRRWAYDVLPQETMEFLLGAPQFTIELQGTEVIAYRGSTFATGDFEAATHVVNGILDRLPKSVLRELKERI